MQLPSPFTRRLLAVAFLVATAQPAHAQVNLPSDTIIRLAVDQSRFTNTPVVVLLDERHYKAEADGRYVATTRQVFQVLSQNVVRGMSERGFSYDGKHQALTLNWVRVLKPTGEVVSEKAAQEQDADMPAQLSNPIYHDGKTKRISLSGVAAGTIIDMSWSLEEKGPYRTGDFQFGWTVANQYPMVRTQFIVDIPEKLQPRIIERNLTFGRGEDVKDGRRIITWTTSNVPAFRSEMFAADSNGVTQSVTVAAPGSWNDIARWYQGLSGDRYTLPTEVAQHIDSVVKASGARTRIDTIRAVHRWVAQDIRYVSVSLGLGGYQPRTPLEVVNTGFGDCKDKATIFVGALRRYRIPANAVLLSNTGRADRAAPSIYEFNHAIAVVGEGDNRVYTDLTAETIPYGELPGSYQGAFGIVVRNDGSAEEIRFPAVPTDSSRSTVVARLVIDTTGAVTGVVEDFAEGNPSHSLRAVFMQSDSARRAAIERSLAQRYFPAGGKVDSLVAFNGKDLSAPTRIKYQVSGSMSLRDVGGNKVLSLSPFIRGPATGYNNTIRQLEGAPARTMPIDASRVLGMLSTVTDIRFVLPEGWTAELPKNVLATSFFGSYESTWTQVGNEVRLVRKIQGQRGIHPPQRIAEVLTWFKTVAADNYEFLVLKPQ